MTTAIPANPDLTMLYTLVARMDEKIDDLSGQMLQMFVPRAEIENRFGELQKQMDRQSAALWRAVGVLLTLLTIVATVLGIFFN